LRIEKRKCLAKAGLVCSCGKLDIKGRSAHRGRSTGECLYPILRIRSGGQNSDSGSPSPGKRLTRQGRRSQDDQTGGGGLDPTQG